ncbi:hypothetical protein OWM54_17710 [Myxococcus sp. MISCRS1]|jgi:hypothetical protein|uniref:hypothetical protein n=2 Tax=Myxococcus TaxID=32 RepID=UPI0011431DE4|nr:MULTISPECIES: hypothetical protein [unclassified Myxococcus]MBZ4395662.1 hypothetical protein [Myxococcus sp. AS-1-15]MCY0998980.1 hypothetical protein [Myxococcus sp. MISCRS1]BDT31017.1 hypothetical protein MFMH1_06860 [Myxococcus sp. MH1]
MKQFLAAFVLSLAVATPAMAQHDGPFADTDALVSYWSAQDTQSSLTQIYVNGKRVYQRSGFGPAFVKEYFDCHDGSGIKSFCNNIFDGYLTVEGTYGTYSPGLAVYLDGVLYRSGSPFSRVDIKTCYGDASYYGPVSYYIVESVIDGFGPPYPGNDCF